MRTRAHEFSWPDRIVIGTIGLPGARTFYLQVRAGKELVSIALEKQQAALLAEKIDEVLDQLSTIERNPFSIPTSTPVELADDEPLEAVQEQFRTGAMSLAWDPTTAQIIIEAESLIDDDPDADGNDESRHDNGADEPESLLVRIPVGTARAFSERTREIVGAGRPLCPLCGEPVDADGHTCTLPEG